MISNLTAAIIRNDPEVYAAHYTLDGKFGVYIGTYDESPSGSLRPRVLLTGNPTYEFATEAQLAAIKLIEDIRSDSCNITN